MKRTTKLIIWLVVGITALLLVGCRSEVAEEYHLTKEIGGRPFIDIAFVSDANTNDFTYITTVLKDHGIECYALECIREYLHLVEVCVPIEKSDEAKKLLEQDSNAKKLLIEFKK